MENDDVEYGRVPNEAEPFEILLRCVESGKKCVEKRPSICMVPSVLRNLSEKSFIPRVVSIGPLHKENENLKKFEWLKHSFLYDLLSRSSDPTLAEQLNECLEKVNDLIEDIRSSYDDMIKEKYKGRIDQLAHMMVLDASFILEFCLKQEYKQDNKEATMLSKIQITCIAIDLLLLENQIPFFVLQTIFDCTINRKGSHQENYLTCLLQKILGKYIHPFAQCTKDSEDTEHAQCSDDSKKESEHAHVLDCLHKTYKVKTSEKVGDCQASLNYNHSVVELDRSGVNFKPQKEKEMEMSMSIIKSRSCYNLSPWSKRTLFMPTLVIQEFTETVLRNFIAYEQFSPEVNYYFTSYASAMDMLIDSEADVGKLVESKVIVNNLGSNRDVATVINGICVNIEIERFCYSEAIQELDSIHRV
uniref:putative UPF0481 protein At3g02645 isoform X2 n=1 Tax=Erigeron canadensis TaxID=72917 RepID=UPI001CB8D337|nr:putative UPF0481 protein At3g02645 isoform X2 [Erigeron canadensis]